VTDVDSDPRAAIDSLLRWVRILAGTGFLAFLAVIVAVLAVRQESIDRADALVRTRSDSRVATCQVLDKMFMAHNDFVQTAIAERQAIIDATGTSALLSRKLNLKRPDPKLKKASLFAHYKGAYRDPNPRDVGATLVLSTKNQDGWFWYIPLPDDIVSIGVVGDIDRLITNRQTKPEETLEDEIRNTPSMVPRLANATRVSPVYVLSDFSYSSKRCAGEGWILIGDAFAFLDPMYSSGVFLALKSAEMAADCVVEAFANNDFSAAQLGKWGQPLSEGMQAIRKLVYAFYTRDFSFGRFTREHPHTKKNLVDLLIGNVFRPGINDIFEPMSKSVPLPDSIPLESPPALQSQET